MEADIPTYISLYVDLDLNIYRKMIPLILVHKKIYI